MSLEENKYCCTVNLHFQAAERKLEMRIKCRSIKNYRDIDVYILVREGQNRRYRGRWSDYEGQCCPEKKLTVMIRFSALAPASAPYLVGIPSKLFLRLSAATLISTPIGQVTSFR